jgi:hypothetical protein
MYYEEVWGCWGTFYLWKCGTTIVGIGRATRPQTNDKLRKSAKNPSERKNQRIRKIALTRDKVNKASLKLLSVQTR